MWGFCLRRVPPNTNEQRSRSGLCERVFRREATETEGLVSSKLEFIFNFCFRHYPLIKQLTLVCVCVFVCPDCIKEMGNRNHIYN